jgi:hypothetical protein
VPLNEDDQIKYGEKRFVYVVLERSSEDICSTYMNVEQILQITITEIDLDTQDELGEYDEEFTSIQPVTLGTADYLKAAIIPMGTYKEAWEALGAQGQQRGNLADQVQTF